MKNIFIIIISFLITGAISAQPSVIYTDEDLIIFNHYISDFSTDNKPLELDELLEKTACFFLDKPYLDHTLETEDYEKLVVNLREFDCTTYIETVIALTQTVRSQEHTFDNFVRNLMSLRYRKGIIDGYSSRLHYFTDWLHHNEKVGVLSNISTTMIGSITEDKHINFMSSHRNLYRHLISDDSNLSEIVNIEKEINNRGGISFIQKSKIDDNISKIPHMSIIAFTTSISGLDVTHTGFALRKDGEIKFIHASSNHNKVIVDSLTISEYCKMRKSCIGIILAKLL